MEIIAKRLNFATKVLLAEQQNNLSLSLSKERYRAVASFFYSNLAPNHRSAIGVKYADLVVDCFYKSKTCTQAHFKPYLHPTLINCYTFQANMTNITGKVLDGPHNGLTLILRSSPSLHFGYEHLDVMQNVQSIRLAIHAPGTLPMMTKKALNLEPGKSTSISLMMKTYDRLGSPYTECQEKDAFELDSRIFKATRDVCREKCMIEEIQKQCNCTSILLEDLTRSDYQYCAGVDNISPIEFEKRSECEYRLAQGEDDVDCTHCIWDCQQDDYDIQTTFSDWPHAEKIYDFINHNVLFKYQDLKPLLRPCTDPVKSFYAFLLKKANMSTKICPQGDERSTNKIPFSLRTVLNKMDNLDHDSDNAQVEIGKIFAFMYDPQFPEMYEYVMDAPQSYYNVTTLKELNAKWVKGSFYRVNIYFRQTSVEQHFQVASFSLADLCSSLGGILGLWLGFSVMTIIEICSFIIKLMYNSCCKVTNNIHRKQVQGPENHM